MREDLAAVNVTRTYTLAGSNIAIFTFMLFFLYPRFEFAIAALSLSILSQPVSVGAQQTPADTMIRLERTNCFFTCPAYVVTISADGLVTFEGSANVRVMGKAESRIAAEKVQDLVAAFLKIKFFSLRNAYSRPEDGCHITGGDTASVITSIRLGGKSKSVNHYLGCFPKKKIHWTN